MGGWAAAAAELTRTTALMTSERKDLLIVNPVIEQNDDHVWRGGGGQRLLKPRLFGLLVGLANHALEGRLVPQQHGPVWLLSTKRRAPMTMNTAMSESWGRKNPHPVS